MQAIQGGTVAPPGQQYPSLFCLSVLPSAAHGLSPSGHKWFHIHVPSLLPAQKSDEEGRQNP